MQKVIHDCSTGEQIVCDMTPEEEAAYLASVPSPPARRLVSKALIVDRLQAAGLLDKAVAALARADIYTRERWNARIFIYADDPTAITLLESIGADPNVILGL